MAGIPWGKILGIGYAKRKLGKMTGIPTTKSGQQRKLKRIVTGTGKKGWLSRLFGG